jgi:hypothetical protein
MKNLPRLIMLLSALFAVAGSQTALADCKIRFDFQGTCMAGDYTGELRIGGVPNSAVTFDIYEGDDAQTILTRARDELEERGFNVTPVQVDGSGRAYFDVLALPGGEAPPSTGGAIGHTTEPGAFEFPSGVSVKHIPVGDQIAALNGGGIEQIPLNNPDASGGTWTQIVATFVRDIDDRIIGTEETECAILFPQGMPPQEQNENIRDSLGVYYDGVHFEGDYIIIPDDADVAGIQLETTDTTHTSMDILVGLPSAAIPTLSEWGLLILALLLLTVGTIAVVGGRKAAMARTN